MYCYFSAFSPPLSMALAVEQKRHSAEKNVWKERKTEKDNLLELNDLEGSGTLYVSLTRLGLILHCVYILDLPSDILTKLQLPPGQSCCCCGLNYTSACVAACFQSSLMEPDNFGGDSETVNQNEYQTWWNPITQKGGLTLGCSDLEAPGLQDLKSIILPYNFMSA